MLRTGAVPHASQSNPFSQSPALIKADLPKVIAPNEAGDFTFYALVLIKMIGGDALRPLYDCEILRIDPDAELEDDCLAVVQVAGGHLYLDRLRLSSRDELGRFVPLGKRQLFRSCRTGITFDPRDCSVIRVVGRLVGAPREFPGSARSPACTSKVRILA